MATHLPKISHVLETCLYVRSAPISAAFYQRVFDIKPHFVTERMASLPLGSTTLLLFTLGKTGDDVHLTSGPTRGLIPWHGPTAGIQQLLKHDAEQSEMLKQHFCFAVESVEDVRVWEERFQALDVEAKGVEIKQEGGVDGEQKVKVLGTVDWERGGRSVYFEDLDGHVGEIAARGIWPHW